MSKSLSGRSLNRAHLISMIADLYQKRALESLGSVLRLVSAVEKRFMGWFPVFDRSLQDDRRFGNKDEDRERRQAPFTLAQRFFAALL